MSQGDSRYTRRGTRRTDGGSGMGKKSARVIAIALVVVLATVGIAVAAMVRSNSSVATTDRTDVSTSTDGSSSREVVSDQSASSGDSATSAASDASTSAASDASTSASSSDSTDEAARQADLELDPSRTTDWLDHSNGVKTVYLTFDDGPSENTEKVLDILDQYGAHATFFVTGMRSDYYDMIGEAYRRGNTIGLHTYTHDYATCYASVDAYFNDLDQIGQVVKDQIGYVPYLVRFPGGSSNTVSKSYCSGIMSALAPELLARGYQYYDWNVSSGDGGGVLSADELVANATAYGNFTNVILLCHDASAKTTTVEALPRIIEYYQSQGFVFQAITRETVVVHHGIQN